MLRSRPDDDRTDDVVPDEAQIRADERANVERELRAMDDRGPEPAGRTVVDEPVVTDRPAGRTVVDEPVVTDRRADDAVVARNRLGPDADVVDDDHVEEIEVVRTRAFSFGQLLTMLVGAALVVLGVFAAIETGLDTPLSQPVEQVMGYDHTPLLAISEIVAGGLLLLFSLRPGGRWFVAALGVALVFVGVMILGELDWTVDELGAEQSYAWIPIVAGLVVLLSSLLTPRRYQRMTGVPTSRVT